MIAYVKTTFEVYLVPNLLVQAIPMCLLWVTIALWGHSMQVVGPQLMVVKRHLRRPSIFKLTQQTNNCDVDVLFLQCIVFLVVDVMPPRYGWIYSILFYYKQYNVMIGNFPGCLCVYFVTMLVASLGSGGICAM